MKKAYFYVTKLLNDYKGKLSKCYLYFDYLQHLCFAR